MECPSAFVRQKEAPGKPGKRRSRPPLTHPQGSGNQLKQSAGERCFFGGQENIVYDTVFFRHIRRHVKIPVGVGLDT